MYNNLCKKRIDAAELFLCSTAWAGENTFIERRRFEVPLRTQSCGWRTSHRSSKICRSLTLIKVTESAISNTLLEKHNISSGKDVEDQRRRICQICCFVKSRDFGQFVSELRTRVESAGDFYHRTPRVCRFNISGGPVMFCSPKRSAGPRTSDARISQVVAGPANKALRHRAARRRLTSALKYLHLIMNVTQRLAESLPMQAGVRGGPSARRPAAAATTQAKQTLLAGGGRVTRFAARPAGAALVTSAAGHRARLVAMQIGSSCRRPPLGEPPCRPCPDWRRRQREGGMADNGNMNIWGLRLVWLCHTTT